MNNIFVGNLSFDATKENVRKLFEEYGTVAGVSLVEKRKGKSRGFAFVDMPDEDQKNKAISSLEGKEFMGRPLIVNPMRPKVPSAKKFFKSKKPWNGEQREERAPRGPRRDDRGAKPYRSDDRPSKPYSKPQGEYKSYGSTSKPYRRDDRDSKPSSGSKPAYKSRDDRDARQDNFKHLQDSKPWGKSKRASQASYSGEKKSSDKKEGFSKFSGKPKANLKSGYGTKSWPKKF